MMPHFEGKETEHNWQDRERAIFRLRGMLSGGIPDELVVAFVLGLKRLQEGIIKAVSAHELLS